jgi:hypothetical protein
VFDNGKADIAIANAMVAFDAAYKTWRAGLYGVDDGQETMAKINAAGELAVTGELSVVGVSDDGGLKYGMASYTGANSVAVQHVFKNVVDSGNTQFIDKPGRGFRAIGLGVFVLNNHADDITINFQSETTAISPNYLLDGGGGGGGIGVILVAGDNKPMNLNLSGTGTVALAMDYIVEAV